MRRFHQGGQAKFEAVNELLSSINRSMYNVTTMASDWTTLNAVGQRGGVHRRSTPCGTSSPDRRSSSPPSRSASWTAISSPGSLLSFFLSLTRRIEYFDSDPEVKSLLARVMDYRELLSCVRQNDYKISEGSTRSFTTALLILWSFAKLLLTSVLMLPGFILALPSLVIVSVYSRRYQKNALKKSSVKIRAMDVVATGKIVSSSLCFVISLIVEPMIILALCAKRGASVTLLDYVAIINILPWLFYLTMYLGGKTSEGDFDWQMSGSTISRSCIICCGGLCIPHLIGTSSRCENT